MLVSGSTARYYLSSNSPKGYLACFSNLYNAKDGWKAYILIGGFGIGISALMKKAGDALEAAGENVEYIYSCLDSSELVAVSFPNLHICMIDGTPPNNLNTEYPGLTEIVINLGGSLNEELLKSHRENIILFTARVSSSSDRAYRFLTAASSLLNDTDRLALECTDLSKLETYAANLSKREFPQKGCQGVETQRFLTAITPDGLTNLFGNVVSGYKRIYEIDDEFGIGKLFLNKLRCSALASGYDVISCPCPMFPDGKPEHLLIPSLSLAFITTGHNHPFVCENTHHIHIRRFINRDTLKLKRPRISFNRKAARELIDESILLLDDAQASRRMIHSYYYEATDIDAINKIGDHLTESILSTNPLQN